MSEQTKLEPDIVQELRAKAKEIDISVGSDPVFDEVALMRRGADEIERLRAERPTWREGIEAAAHMSLHVGSLYSGAGERRAARKIAQRIRALTPPSIGVAKEKD